MATPPIKSEREILNRAFEDSEQALKTTVEGTVTIDPTDPIDVNIIGGGDVRLLDENSELIDIQNPLQVDGDSVHIADIDFTNSDFTGWVGNPEDLFTSPFSASLTNSTTNNPKQMILSFKRTIQSLQVGFGENNGGDFSNMKLSLLGSGGSIRGLFDSSSDNTKRTSLNASFDAQLYNSLLIEFYTTDPVSLSNITIQKAAYNTSQIVGKTPRGEFTNFNATTLGNFKVALEEYQGDAFGRLKTSLPFTIFDSTLTYGFKDLYWSNLINNGSSVSQPNQSRARLTVDAGVGNYVIEQSKMRMKYQPGKALEVLMTGYLSNETDVIKRIGYFDVDDGTTISETPKNGIFFENNSGVWSWNIANNGVVTETATQDQWNVDTLDGNGPSLQNLDLDSVQIWFLDLEWLGVGAVRCGFVLDGAIVVCHAFQHANAGFDAVYMQTANLPVNYSIISNGGAGSMDHICTTVVSGGGFNPIGLSKSVSNDSPAVINNNQTRSVVGVRLNENNFNATILPKAISVIATAKSDARVSLCFNPTYTGTATWNNITNSTIQYSETSLAITDKGIILSEAFISENSNTLSSDLETSLRLGKALSGILDEVWIVIESLNANDSYYASYSFTELL